MFAFSSVRPVNTNTRRFELKSHCVGANETNRTVCQCKAATQMNVFSISVSSHNRISLVSPVRTHTRPSNTAHFFVTSCLLIFVYFSFECVSLSLLISFLLFLSRARLWFFFRFNRYVSTSCCFIRPKVHLNFTMFHTKSPAYFSNESHKIDL